MVLAWRGTLCVIVNVTFSLSWLGRGDDSLLFGSACVCFAWLSGYVNRDWVVRHCYDLYYVILGSMGATGYETMTLKGRGTGTSAQWS
jgi:hypothetical protein